MLEQMMLPLDRQFDDGLQATGSAFKSAAEKLSAIPLEHGLARSNAHLPINYLYRHSIELFLKSMIVTVHRALDLPGADGTHSPDPKVDINGKSIPLTRIHSVKTLMDEFQRLRTANLPAFEAREAHGWDTPADLRESIDIIESYDSGSTFSRYPRSGSTAEADKSSFIEVDPNDIIDEIQQQEGERRRIILAVTDENDCVITAFCQQDNPLPVFREAMVNAAAHLYGSAFGIHAELVDCIRLKAKQRREAESAATQE